MPKNSLIGDLSRNKVSDTQLIKKTKLSSSKSFRTNTIQNKLDLIKVNVNKYLGKYSDIVEVVRTEERLKEFIDNAVKNGIISIDTETDGLNPLVNHIIGVCLYTPNEKAIYIPTRHKSYVTQQLLSNQLQPEILEKYFNLIKDNNVKVIMHNAKFDKRFINSNYNVNLDIYWDTMLASKCINNIESAALKFQYSDKLENHKKEYDFESLFRGMEQALIPVDVFSLYAAVDAYITYKLYLWQEEKFKELPRVYNVFKNIEVPLIEVVSAMEDTGISLDIDYAKTLSVKYHKLLDEAYKNVEKELKPYNAKIKEFADKGKKIEYPMNITSPTQLAVLFYDILEIPPVDKKKPRGTGEEILVKIDLPICKAILEVRKLEKLIGTYIDKLPEVVLNDGKIHASFNQYGADTGRFSSSDPNLQNIPSHNKDIRKMFIASPGYYMASMDYSKQEPFTLAEFSQDEKFMANFNGGKDVYAMIASDVYKKPYEQCLEFNPDGTTNPEGKERRSNAKSILLGIMYSRGANSIAEQTGSTVKEAQAIIDSFHKSYPQADKWIKQTVEDAKKNGYVETLAGRRRQIPDMLLPEYSYELISSKPVDFNPMSFDTETELSFEVDEKTKQVYNNKLKNCFKFTEKQKIIEDAYKDGIKIKDNSLKVGDATRQCVNSRIQGSAADMTKSSMINIYNNKRLKELGCRLLVCIHDEVIVEAPKENAKEAFELVSKIMVDSAKQFIHLPIKCDAEVTEQWYGKSIEL